MRENEKVIWIQTYFSEENQQYRFEGCDGLIYYLNLFRSEETFLLTFSFPPHS